MVLVTGSYLAWWYLWCESAYLYVFALGLRDCILLYVGVMHNIEPTSVLVATHKDPSCP